MRAIYPIVGDRHISPRAVEIVRSLKAGEAVTLEREPLNPRDPNCVKVVARGEHVGWIPAAMVRKGLAGYIDEHGAPAVEGQSGPTIEGKFAVAPDHRPTVEIEEVPA